MRNKIAIVLLKIINKLFLNSMKGKKNHQRFFEYLHSIALQGMNYDNGNKIEINGELETIKYIRSKLFHKEQIVIFDIGANEGQYCINLIKAFHNTNIIINSFEPSKKTFESLKNNLSDYKIQIHNLGLGNENGKKVLYTSSNTGLAGLASVYKRNLTHHNIDLNDSEEIEIITIDNFCNQNNITEIDFLKLDIEGNEFKALEGAVNMIKNDKIKFIQFEFGGTDIDAKTFFQDFYYLLKEKYNLYRIVQDGIHPIKNYTENIEIFAMINFLAEHK